MASQSWLATQVKNIQWLGPVTVLLLTGLGYGTAYIFERGFAEELGIPTDFIKVDLISIINTIFILVLVLGVMACVFYFISLVYPQSR
jgi:hypothetical protein